MKFNRKIPPPPDAGVSPHAQDVTPPAPEPEAKPEAKPEPKPEPQEKPRKKRGRPKKMEKVQEVVKGEPISPEPEVVEASPSPPKKADIRKAIERMMDSDAISMAGDSMVHPVTGQRMTNAEAIAFSLVTRAANGEKDATREVLDRILGKPTQSLDVNARNTIETTERVSSIARRSINSLADGVVGTIGGGRGVPELRPDLDVPEDGAESPEAG